MNRMLEGQPATAFAVQVNAQEPAGMKDNFFRHAMALNGRRT